MLFFNRKNILIVLCSVFSFLCIFGVTNMGRLGSGYVLHYGRFYFPISSIQGVLSALNSLSCILMVFIDFKKGSKVAFAVMTLTLLSSLRPIIVSQSFASLPGVVTVLISFFTVIIIYSFHKKTAMNSLTDYITGLPNRVWYIRDINAHLADKEPFYLVCIEIENYKTINDLYGVENGDVVLKSIAEKLNEMFGKSDRLYKITGGLFVILIEEKNFVEDKLSLVIRSEMVMLPPAPDEEQNITKNCMVSLAAGIVKVDDSYKNQRKPSVLMRDSELALMEAKKSQTDKIVYFSENTREEELEQKEAEFLIMDALKNYYFYLVYQPQYIAKDKKLRGFETLIRCKKPDGSIVSPTSFIPVAEKSNLILEIDDFVLRHAMTEFKPVLERFSNSFILSVNVSAKNICMEDFSQRLKKMIDELNFPPENLEIEITEYSFAESMETTIDNILALRSMGVQIALDDFGTGYTSIAQLMKLPVNLLKIDKSLIDEIESDPVMSDMVDSIIYMGHIMDCEVISEGVENENQLEILKEHKCDFIQGFVWGKPLSFERAKELCGL